MSKAFEDRLLSKLPDIVGFYGTPFHIYDEVGIRETGEQMKQAFSGVDFQEFYAVKALPNPRILQIVRDLGFGFDCSSVPELIMAREAGASPEDIMFTSNNTSREEFEVAMSNGGCRLNLDDITLISKVPKPFPKEIWFRYNPGPRRTGNSIIGNPVEAKYGITHEQLWDAYRAAIENGAERFGLHTMVCSNERKYKYMVETIRMLLNIIGDMYQTGGIKFDAINCGGGLGIPYRPKQKPFRLEELGAEATTLIAEFEAQRGWAPALFMESGRYLTGPHGVLVTQVINQKHTYREYRGLDACQSALMRPALYDAYHHITVMGGKGRKTEVVDVVGSVCENCDKFAKQRELPKMQEGDIVIIHDTGAHGHAMGFQYNARLRPQELLLCDDGSVELIRRAETADDYFATLRFEPKQLAF